jgi:hypothetical protein
VLIAFAVASRRLLHLAENLQQVDANSKDGGGKTRAIRY